MNRWTWPLRVLVILVAGMAPCFLAAQEDLAYQVPPKEILELADVALPPVVSLPEGGTRAVLMYRDVFRRLEELARPELRLGGLRLDPLTLSPSRVKPVVRLGILNLATGKEEGVEGLGTQERLLYFSWSPDQSRLAFCRVGPEGLEGWVLELARARAHRLGTLQLNGALGNPLVWCPDGRALLARVRPADSRSLKDSARDLPRGPVVSGNEGRKAQVMTYQDLLKTPVDAFNFEQVVRSELRRVSLEGADETWMKAEMIRTVSFSPDGRFVRVTFLEKPFSYLVPYGRFPSRTVICDARGQIVHELVRTPLQEVLPQGNMAVPTGIREVDWRDDRPAELMWVEALDGGDPSREAVYRDEIFTLQAPFGGGKRSLLKVHGRLSGVTWGENGLAVVRDLWWNTRNTKTYLVPTGGGGEVRVLFDRNYQDRYADPGRFVTRRNHWGREVLMTRGQSLLLQGQGFSAQGVRPFLDALDPETGQISRLWQADGRQTLEEIVQVRDPLAGTMITRIQARDRYPNLFERRIGGGEARPLTRFANPFAALSGLRKEVIRYRRADGVDLSATLYWPLGYQPGKRYPMILWAYPREFKNTATAGQVSTSPHEFVYPYYGSPVFWVARGYVVLDDAAFPIVGEGQAEPNDTFIPQLVANARAAIDAVDARGLIDRKRVAVGGHSYGAFMTANLLTHSDLFAAGIARSGAYNRSLTPFGFQSEERNFWEAQEVYLAMSPFMSAHRMKTPLLLIHGAADNNPGTHTLQSERYFNALKGLGATVRLVLLPFESHGYVARESVLHLLWEQDRWLETYLGPEREQP